MERQQILYKDMIHVETVSAELAITQPREISLDTKTLQQLSKSAVYDQAVKELINARIATLRQT